MNLKQILNRVLSESTFLEKPAFTSSNDPDDKQMVAIANAVAYHMFNWCHWGVLKATHTVTMTEDKLYPLPDGFQSMIPDSAWETDGSRRVEVPTAEGRWYMYKYSTYSDGGTLRARLQGPNIELYDTQPGESFAFEYITKYPITDAGGTPKEYFTLDDDIFLLDPEVLIKGIKAQWAEGKMMPQAEKWELRYLSDLNAAKGRDTGGRTIGGHASDNAYIESRQPYYPLYRRG